MAGEHDPVLPDRKTMNYIERRLKEFKAQLGPMKRGPKRWPRKGGGGGGEIMIAVITSAVPPRSGNTYGFKQGVDIGHLSGDGFSVTLTNQTIYNPSLESVHASPEDVHVPVAKINDRWVLIGALELRQAFGFNPEQLESLGHDANGIPEWQLDGDCDAVAE